MDRFYFVLQYGIKLAREKVSFFSDDKLAGRVDGRRAGIFFPEWLSYVRSWVERCHGSGKAVLLLAEAGSILPPTLERPTQVVPRQVRVGLDRDDRTNQLGDECCHSFTLSATLKLDTCRHDEDAADTMFVGQARLFSDLFRNGMNRFRFDLYHCTRCGQITLKAQDMEAYDRLLLDDSVTCDRCLAAKEIELREARSSAILLGRQLQSEDGRV
jgi:hypothetical protein